jgi:hypothetical protein
MRGNTLQLFLYRTMEVDEDGDPYDHGNVRAPDFEGAAALLQEHLADFGSSFSVRLYQLRDREDAGVLESTADDYREFQLDYPDDGEA